MKSRRLKAYPTGDHWRGKTVPQIRLQGQWLEQAGFPPFTKVVVEIEQNGVLVIRKEEKTLVND
jgi:hypothetical protein